MVQQRRALLGLAGLAAAAAFTLPAAGRRPPAGGVRRARAEAPKLAFGFTGHDDDFVPWKELDAAPRSPLQRQAELDPEALNELFSVSGANRLKAQVNPLGAYGAVFRLETLVDVSSVHHEAWLAVADRLMWRKPNADAVTRTLTMMPERAIMEEFYWTQDWRLARDAAEIFRTELVNAQEAFVKKLEDIPLESRQGLNGIVSPETVEFINTLVANDAPIALVSTLDDAGTQQTLRLAGLDHIPFALVTREDGHDRDQQAFLAAAYKLETAPQRMVVFDETPAAAIAAHEAGMKVVCLIGAYARYELHLADMAITSFSDLNAMSFSRIFAGEDFDPQPALEPLPEPKRRVRVATKTRVAAPPAKADAETETKTAEAASKIEVPDYPPRPSRRTRLDDDEFTMPRRKTFQKV